VKTGKVVSANLPIRQFQKGETDVGSKTHLSCLTASTVLLGLLGGALAAAQDGKLDIHVTPKNRRTSLLTTERSAKPANTTL